MCRLIVTQYYCVLLNNVVFYTLHIYIRDKNYISNEDFQMLKIIIFISFLSFLCVLKKRILK